MIGEFIATHKFLVGLIAGGFVGVGLGILVTELFNRWQEWRMWYRNV